MRNKSMLGGGYTYGLGVKAGYKAVESLPELIAMTRAFIRKRNSLFIASLGVTAFGFAFAGFSARKIMPRRGTGTLLDIIRFLLGLPFLAVGLTIGLVGLVVSPIVGAGVLLFRGARAATRSLLREGGPTRNFAKRYGSELTKNFSAIREARDAMTAPVESDITPLAFKDGGKFAFINESGNRAQTGAIANEHETKVIEHEAEPIKREVADGYENDTAIIFQSQHDSGLIHAGRVGDDEQVKAIGEGDESVKRNDTPRDTLTLLREA